MDCTPSKVERRMRAREAEEEEEGERAWMREEELGEGRENERTRDKMR